MDAVVRFDECFPGQFAGGTIGWGEFWAKYERLHIVLAMRRATMARAVSIGWGGESAMLAFRADVTEGFGNG